MFKPSLPLPEITQGEILYKGFFDLRLDHLRLPHGAELAYTVIAAGVDAVCVIAETEEGHLVVNREFRYPVRHWLLSFPGGRIDPNEEPLTAARRELLEETGFSSDEFQFLGANYPFAATCDQKIHFFLAKNAKRTHTPQREPFELIETSLLSPQALQAEIISGTPVDGILCTALFLKAIAQNG